MPGFESLAQLAYIGPGAGITFLGSFLVLFSSVVLLFLSVLTWPIRAIALKIKRYRLGLNPEASRVIVIGLDGLDPGMVRRLVKEGRLPVIQGLAESGTLLDLATTLPPISPVAWSSFQTGVNPGKHNIFDFLNRDLRTCVPELSSARIMDSPKSGWRRWFGSGTTIRLLRKSQPFWKILGDHGIFSTILRVPITFPPERFFGLSLSAMCTPDLRGTQGTFTLFTSEPGDEQSTGGLRIHVRPEGNCIEARLPGPPQSTGTTPTGAKPSDCDALLNIRILDDLHAEVRVSGQKIVLPLCRESDWVRVEFRPGFFARVRGICKFRLESLAPYFRLYVSPIHLDPQRPAMPISHPLYFSTYLAMLHRSFGTLGLAEDTWGLNSGVVGEAAFLEQAWAIHDERERMLFDSLRRMQRGLTVCVFDGPDRIQHMFWRYGVPDHPANQNRDTTEYATVIDDMYVRMDNLVQRVTQELKAGDVLFVISDHGFCDFSRGVNLNVWLKENGYLFVHESATSGDYFSGVDWTRTRAYSFGLAGIYVNQKGREERGIVAASESGALRQEIVHKLSSLYDHQRSRSAVVRVHDCHTEYSGPYVSNGPDVIVGYEKGYRASWENAVGRVDGPLFRDNDRPWSGDHCVDPSLVPGLMLVNRKLSANSCPSIMDFAPTILKLFGVPLPAYFDGKPWEFESTDTIQTPKSELDHSHKPVIPKAHIVES